MNLSKREKWIALITLAVVALWVLDGWVVSGLYRAYRSDASRLRKACGDLFAAESLMRQAPGMEASWRRARNAGIADPPPKAVSSMLGNLRNFAQDAGLKIDMRPNLRPRKEDFQLLLCRISGEGRMAAVSKLCYLIETSPAPLRIEKLRLSAPDATQDTLRLQVDVSCKVHNPESHQGANTVTSGRTAP